MASPEARRRDDFQQRLRRQHGEVEMTPFFSVVGRLILKAGWDGVRLNLAARSGPEAPGR